MIARTPWVNRLLAIPAATLLLVSAADTLAGTRHFRGTTVPVKFSMHGTPHILPDVAFEDGSGRRVRLSDFRGKVVVLNVWASWCGPCREEMPTLDRLQAKLGGSNFQVIALSADATGVNAVHRFFDRVAIRHLSTYIDPTSEALSQLNVVALPTTLLLNRGGAEIGRLIGPAQWDSPEMLNFLRRVIGTTPEKRTVNAADVWRVTLRD